MRIKIATRDGMVELELSQEQAMRLVACVSLIASDGDSWQGLQDIEQGWRLVAHVELEGTSSYLEEEIEDAILWCQGVLPTGEAEV